MSDLQKGYLVTPKPSGSLDIDLQLSPVQIFGQFSSERLSHQSFKR